MSGAGSAEAEDVVKQIQDVQGRDISLEEKNRLINSILSHSSSRYTRYRSSFPSRFILIPVKLEPSAGATLVPRSAIIFVQNEWMEYDYD